MVCYGDYIIQSIGGYHEMVGNDVNLIHRLLKYHIADVTGWRGYALLTDQALFNVGLKAVKRELDKLKVKEAYEIISQLVIQEDQAASGSVNATA